MIGWSGKMRFSRRYGGRFGGDVRLGDVLVPRHAFFDVHGDNGHPDLHAHFEVRDGRPMCVEFTVKAKDDGRGIRSADVEAFGLDALTAAVFAQLGSRLVDESTAVSTSEERDRWNAAGRVEDAVKRPGREASRLDLERVARVYREHIGGSPVRAVMGALNLRSERTAQRRIKAARDAGLLPYTTRGKRRA